MVAIAGDFCGLPSPITVTPAQHILDWFTPELRQLLNCSAIDRAAGKAVGTFANFLGERNNVTLNRAGVRDYYPVLLLLGYLPPSAYWTPTRFLTPEETSSDMRTWLTLERRRLLNLTKIDTKSGVSRGILLRYLKNEPNVSLRLIGKQVYYPILQLFGFVPSPSVPLLAGSFISEAAAAHLLTWFTPERRELISIALLDARAKEPADTFAKFLAGLSGLPKATIHGYYTALRPVGYRPDLDLSRDESVQAHLREKQEPPK